MPGLFPFLSTYTRPLSVSPEDLFPTAQTLLRATKSSVFYCFFTSLRGWNTHSFFRSLSLSLSLSHPLYHVALILSFLFLYNTNFVFWSGVMLFVCWFFRRSWTFFFSLTFFFRQKCMGIRCFKRVCTTEVCCRGLSIIAIILQSWVQSAPFEVFISVCLFHFSRIILLQREIELMRISQKSYVWIIGVKNSI